MSQAPRGKHDWIRDHYEKAILMVVLLALFISCVLLVQQIQTDKETAGLNLSRISWKGSVVSLQDTIPFEKVLEEARVAASSELTRNSRTTISELRVACVKCGRPIPYEAVECPFCLGVQPPIVNIDTLDTDKDGIPDKIELALGLNPQDSADAVGDLDNDGFSNLEEHSAGTEPKNPGSLPDPIVKLRVAGI